MGNWIARNIQFLAQIFFLPGLFFLQSSPKKKTRERYLFNPRHFVSCPFFLSKQTKMTQSQKAILFATFRIWLSKMLTSSVHDEKWPCEAKIIKQDRLFSQDLMIKNPHQILPHTCGQAEQSASRGKELRRLPQECTGLKLFAVLSYDRCNSGRARCFIGLRAEKLDR